MAKLRISHQPNSHSTQDRPVFAPTLDPYGDDEYIPIWSAGSSSLPVSSYSDSPYQPSTTPDPYGYSNKRVYLPDEDIWGDRLPLHPQASRSTNPTLLDIALRHKRTGAILAGAATLATTGIIGLLGSNSSNSDSPSKRVTPTSIQVIDTTTPELTKPTIPYGSDMDGDGVVSGVEVITHDDLALISDTGQEAIQTSPITLPLDPYTPDSQAVFLEENAQSLISIYKPQFIGAYQQREGLAFNIYAATQEGQEGALNQNFQINPESIDFVMNAIEANIADAPDTETRDSIIANLQKTKTGEFTLIIPLVIDVSETAGCLSDPDLLMIEFVEGVCRIAGVTNKYSFSGGGFLFTEEPKRSSPDITPMVISAGAISRNSGTAKQLERQILPSPAIQANVFGHELGHALSDETSTGTYTDQGDEPDDEHETIDWLIGDRLDSYDFLGQTTNSPKLGLKIKSMIEFGALKPILEVIE